MIFTCSKESINQGYPLIGVVQEGDNSFDVRIRVLDLVTI